MTTPNSQPSLPPSFGVTVGDVETWRIDVARHEEQIRDLSSKRDKLLARIEAAHSLFSMFDMSPAETGRGANPAEDASAPAPSPSAPDPDGEAEQVGEVEVEPETGGLSFVSAVRSIVGTADDGIVIAAVKSRVAMGPLGKRLSQSNKGFYNAVSRLANRGEIIRYNGRLFTHEAYAKFKRRVRAGLVADDAPKHAVHSPMGEAILAIVKDAPGIKGGDIITALRINPEFNAALYPHQTGAYNIISRLVLRKQIKKTGREYHPLDKGV